MSTSFLVDLALDDLFLGIFGLPLFMAGLELWDLDFLELVGFERNTSVWLKLDQLLHFDYTECIDCSQYFTIVKDVCDTSLCHGLSIHLWN